ncbi:hypothetical protein TRFO_41719 [Tritrichomonas foetus]|uniref:MatE family protein n=1 Tax=Tritrichomonas foetus TaxID=1144522 RepID=A0A1J4L0C9_9EUKA|nr:hypothetical protein TRFO_41719 [Tritrichomonas foetus]|eukprot:OHT16592.1 hypothetical protein TRFO_41719 [Tritrichomonas foetus]
MKNDSVNTLLMTTEIEDSESHRAFEENSKFIKHGPFVTLLLLSIGAFLTTFGQSVLESVDLYFISKRFEKDEDQYAVQIIGMGYYIVLICAVGCMFFAQSIIARVSGLIGEGKRNEASQLTIDVFRLSIISSIFFQVIMIFCARPIMLFAGCSDDLIDKCFSLVTSTVACLPIFVFFFTTTGFLQGIGKPVLNGIYHLIANILQTFIITPILQFILKIDVTISNISQAIAQSLVGLFILFLIMNGKYTLRPKYSMFFESFSKETKRALIMGLPVIPSMIYIILPPMLLLRFMTNAAAGDSKTVKDIIAVFTVFQKTILIGSAIPVALVSGMLSSGTHSYGMRNSKRMIQTIIWNYVVSTSVLVMFSIVMIFWPNLIANPFLNDESSKQLASKFLPIPFWTFTLQTLCVTASASFVVVGHPNLSTFCNVTMIVLVCVAAKIINVMYPNDYMKVLYSYTITDTISFIFIGSWSLAYIIKTKKEMDQHAMSDLFTSTTDFTTLDQ